MTTEHKPHSEPGTAGAVTPSEVDQSTAVAPRVSAPVTQLIAIVREGLNADPAFSGPAQQAWYAGKEALDDLEEQVASVSEELTDMAVLAYEANEREKGLVEQLDQLQAKVSELEDRIYDDAQHE